MADSVDSLFICGPTACGKTAVAVRIAALLGGEILSADSRQVYRGMDLGTGKDLHEYVDAGVRYHLIDCADPSETYTLQHYLSDFSEVFTSLRARGVLPVVCGGTGLYIEAVLRGFVLSEIPEDPAFRDAMMLLEKEEIINKLSRYPEHLACADMSSKKRLVRSLEKAMAGGVPGGRGKPIVSKPKVFALYYPREIILKRIDARLDQRIDDGMIDEVSALLNAGVSPERIDSFGMEYRHLLRYIKGAVSLDQMREDLRGDIHRLAKRQMTWFRGMERRGVVLRWINLAEEDPFPIITDGLT